MGMDIHMQHDKFIMSGSVLSNREVRDGHFLMSLRLPPEFASPLPGQFAMIRLKSRKDLLLGRPFSISGFDRHERHVQIEILYRIAGQGTRLFSQLQVGDYVELLGPLGHPFEIPPGTKQVILVSGGIGIAPIRYLLAYLRTKRFDPAPGIDLFMGAKTGDELLELENIRPSCDSLQVCTDDCSVGHHGFVTEPLEKKLKDYPLKEALICACGPLGMIRRLSELLTQHPVDCQVSLEERMACGLGACLGCAVAVRGQKGERQYQRVCREGPVFNLKDILWE
jgi:dihydroorotate dehydrogenase electron transfer subunit